MLLTHLALTQNTSAFAFHQINPSQEHPESVSNHQLFPADNQRPTGVFSWLFEGTESLNEAEDLIEEDTEDDHLPEQCAQVCTICSPNHQIKFVSLNQSYILNFIAFKQTPLFVMFHSWKSYLA